MVSPKKERHKTTLFQTDPTKASTHPKTSCHLGIWPHYLFPLSSPLVLCRNMLDRNLYANAMEYWTFNGGAVVGLLCSFGRIHGYTHCCCTRIASRFESGTDSISTGHAFGTFDRSAIHRGQSSQKWIWYEFRMWLSCRWHKEHFHKTVCLQPVWHDRKRNSSFFGCTLCDNSNIQWMVQMKEADIVKLVAEAAAKSSTPCRGKVA